MPATKHPVDLAIHEDLRSIRKAAGLTLEQIGEVIDMDRQAMSKIELGVSRIRLFDYLRIVWFCREAIPEHPAVELARFYVKRRGW